MKLTDSMEDQILHITDLDTALSLLRSYALQNPDTQMQEALRQGTWGVHIHFHARHYIEKRYNEKPKLGTIFIAGLELSIEELWEEIDLRLAIVKRALLDHLQDEDIVEDEWTEAEVTV